MNTSRPWVVVLWGAESTGKSTLSRQLAAHYRTLYNPEFVRPYLEQRHLRGMISNQKSIDYSDVEAVALGQLISEKNALVQAQNIQAKLLFLDTNLLSTAIYSRELYQNEPSWLPDAIREQPYDYYLLLHNDLAWQADEQRESPQAQAHFQALFHAHLTEQGLPFTTIRGNENQRFEQAVAVIDQLRPK
jgi:HTH-type transcriptional regulator, transcriptional repressor of NAD biosynthesis genes